MSLLTAPRNRAVSAANPPRVSAGQIGAGDDRVRRDRTALVGLQRPALPFGRAVIRWVQASTRRHLDWPERSQQQARTVAMTMTGDRAGRLVGGERNLP